MYLKSLLDLKMGIERSRQQMYDLAINKGIDDQETIKLSKELDLQIVSLQKILVEMKSLSA